MTDSTWTHPTLSRGEFLERLLGVEADEVVTRHEHVLALAGEEIPYWWLSFVDANRPLGDRFLGACMVQAATDMGAVGRAHELKINPGGSVAIAGPFQAETMSAQYRQQWCERLLSRAEAEGLPGPDLIP